MLSPIVAVMLAGASPYELLSVVLSTTLSAYLNLPTTEVRFCFFWLWSYFTDDLPQDSNLACCSRRWTRWAGSAR